MQETTYIQLILVVSYELTDSFNLGATFFII